MDHMGVATFSYTLLRNRRQILRGCGETLTLWIPWTIIRTTTRRDLSLEPGCRTTSPGGLPLDALPFGEPVMNSRQLNDFPGTDRFSVRRRLGAGGMGVVYEAYDREARTDRRAQDGAAARWLVALSVQAGIPEHRRARPPEPRAALRALRDRRPALLHDGTGRRRRLPAVRLPGPGDPGRRPAHAAQRRAIQPHDDGPRPRRLGGYGAGDRRERRDAAASDRRNADDARLDGRGEPVFGRGGADLSIGQPARPASPRWPARCPDHAEPADGATGTPTARRISSG